jgi:hypothetical protein
MPARRVSGRTRETSLLNDRQYFKRDIKTITYMDRVNAFHDHHVPRKRRKPSFDESDTKGEET